MPRYLRANTSMIVIVGPAVASADGLTRLSTMVLSATDRARLLKHNSSAAGTNISGNTCSPIVSSEGLYALTLSTGNTDTIGFLTAYFGDDSLMLPWRESFQVLEEVIYDALIADGAAAFDASHDVTVGGFAAGAITAAAFAASAITSNVLADNAIDASVLSASAITSAKIAASAITSAQIADDAITAAKIAASAITSSELADGAITAAKFAASAITSNVLADNAIDASVLSADAGTEIGTAVWASAARTITGLEAAALADFFGTNSGTTYSAAVAGSVVAEIADNAGGSALTEAGIADAVWDEARAGHTTDGSFGQGVVVNSISADAITATAIAADAITSAEIAAGAITAAKFAASAITSNVLADNAIDSSVISAGAITAAKFAASAITSAVLADDAIDSTVIADGALTQAKLADNAIASAKLSADAVTKIQAGLATSTAVAAVQTSVDAVVTAVDTEVAAILAAVDTEVAAILALLDDARGEPGQGNPPVNPDLATKIDYLYKAWRNKKTTTSAEFSLFADDGTTVDQKATLSDDGTTFTFGEMATGA